MEVVKDTKVPENGVEREGDRKEGKSLDNMLEQEKDSKEITESDLSNLRQIFTWALTVTTKDRAILASILTFEDSLFKKLTNKK